MSRRRLFENRPTGGLDFTTKGWCRLVDGRTGVRRRRRARVGARTRAGVVKGDGGVKRETLSDADRRVTGGCTGVTRVGRRMSSCGCWQGVREGACDLGKVLMKRMWKKCLGVPFGKQCFTATALAGRTVDYGRREEVRRVTRGKRNVTVGSSKRTL